jgi:putative endonuclease
MALHNETGEMGEALAVRFLEERGYEIVEQNYRKKWGEIDIVATKDYVLCFVEVKASIWKPQFHDTGTGYRPEENIRQWKKLRMGRAVRTYFIDRRISDDTDFQIDVISLLLDFDRKKARIRVIENVILE